MADLTALIERLEKAAAVSNELDVEIEIALFDPAVFIRANAAGTKVIYTMRSGLERTHYAGDHTLGPEARARSIAALRALSAQEGSK